MDEFYADVVPDGYDSESQKWHVSYWHDVESEDLTVYQVLESLVDPNKGKAPKKMASKKK